MIRLETCKALKRSLAALRRKGYRDFNKFRAYYFKDYHKTDDAGFHGEVAAMLENMSRQRGMKLALAAPRSSAKSTIISLEYVIYSICYELENFICIFSNTADQASNLLGHIKRELESNERLREDYPEVCELNVKPGPSRWSQREIITKNNIKVLAAGFGQGIRGSRHQEHRPTLLILDDIETNDMTLAEEGRYKLKDWLEKTVLKLGSARSNYILTGTIHHYGSLLAQYVDPRVHPGWLSRVYKSVIKWSPALNEWQEWSDIYCNKKEYAGQTGPLVAKAYFEANRDKMLQGTEVLWPQSKSYYDLMVMREQDGPASFDSEMQNEPVNPRDCFFNVEELGYWDDEYKSEEELIASLKNPVFFAACDPSLGKDRSRGDYSAIITGVMERTGDKMYVLDADLERRKPDNLIETIVGYASSRPISMIAIENNGFQELLSADLEQRLRKQMLPVQLQRIETRGNKIERIQVLQPSLKSGVIQLSRRHRALIDQLKFFPKAMHDDGPDALEMLFQCFNLLKRKNRGPILVGGKRSWASEGENYDVVEIP